MFLPRPSAASASVRSGRAEPAHGDEGQRQHDHQQHRQRQQQPGRQACRFTRQCRVEGCPLAVQKLHLRDQPNATGSRAATAHAAAGAHHHRVAVGPRGLCIRGRVRASRHLHLSIIAERRPQHRGEHACVHTAAVLCGLGQWRAVERDHQRRHVQDAYDASALRRIQRVKQTNDVGDALDGLHPRRLQQHAVALGPIDPGAEPLREHKAHGQHAHQAAEQGPRPRRELHGRPVTATAST